MSPARLILIIALLAGMWCAVGVATAADEPAKSGGPQRIDTPYLPNAYRIADKVISGGEPEGDDAFRTLKDLGVKTIISVDGAQPRLDLAAKYGLRYVHLPHGYDGIPDERARELAKAVRDLPGPIYIHCHHGQHRSPAAATVACVAVGFLAPADALNVLKTAGTSENYRGLYQSAQSARRIDDELLDTLKVEFVPAAKIPPIADAMVEIEHTHDHLKSLSDNGWQRLPTQPDLDAAHEALLLKEHYRELLRTDAAQRQPAEFQKLLAGSERTAESLETVLRAWQKAGAAGKPPESVGQAFTAISQSCTACHRQFRDVPLGEKRK